MSPRLPALVAAVQANCAISDARFARELSLCNYLLAMREYFRWENDLPLDAAPPRGEVARWIAEREALWDAVEGADWEALPLGAGACDPFAARDANAALEGDRLVYGAAVGRFGKPSFFLGRLERRETRSGVDVVEVGCEYARDIDAAPAAYQDGTVVFRREAFERWLWTRTEAWEASGGAAMGAALAAYGFADERAAALARMAEGERETLVLHELGEHAAGQRLGEPWEAFMAANADRRVELLARAVRDLLADCLVTLPALVERGAAPSLHFWRANFGGLRESLFPRLVAAFSLWGATGRAEAIAEAAAAGRGHWERVAAGLAAAGAPDARRLARDPASIALA